jgi:hypothetical protein
MNKLLVMLVTSPIAMIAACGSSPAAAPAQSDNANQSTAPTSGGDRCGMHLFEPGRDPVCQAKLDFACCVPERQCAAAKGCVEFIACVNRCAVRRSDECERTCAPTGRAEPGIPEFMELARCSKQAALPPDVCHSP